MISAPVIIELPRRDIGDTLFQVAIGKGQCEERAGPVAGAIGMPGKMGLAERSAGRKTVHRLAKISRGTIQTGGMPPEMKGAPYLEEMSGRSSKKNRRIFQVDISHKGELCKHADMHGEKMCRTLILL